MRLLSVAAGRSRPLRTSETRGGQILKSMRLVNYRGFIQFSVSFAKESYLIGPNNAGKSTILTALRVVDSLIRVARARNPSRSAMDGGRQVLAYPISLTDYPQLRESIRHEFYGDEEVRLVVEWRSGASLTAIWPADDADDEEKVEPFFYLDILSGMQPRSVNAVKEHFPILGVIPILTPIEHTETLLQDAYVRANVASRLSSRHFRNQIRQLCEAGKWQDFLTFVGPWLQGFELNEQQNNGRSQGNALDIYYHEQGSRIPKELTWAGDGMQVWLQILFHVFRVMACDTLILDEPEVYLHPDLQRRLVRLLEETGAQIVVATHSSEVAAEVEPQDLVLIDRVKSRGIRAKSVAVEEQIGTALGSQFNLKLAKALRSKAVVFVEGNDLGLLRPICRTLGMPNLATERGVSVISLGGFSMWVHVEAFDWLVKELLPDAIKTFVILDRDYRSDTSIADLEASLAAKGIVPHVWRRKELESYLLTADIVSRATGLSRDEVETLLVDALGNLEGEVFGGLVAERIQEIGGGSQNHSRASGEIKVAFDRMWKDANLRMQIVPPKSLLSGLNARLQADGNKAISFRALAQSVRRRDLPSEFIDTLQAVDDASG